MNLVDEDLDLLDLPAQDFNIASLLSDSIVKLVIYLSDKSFIDLGGYHHTPIFSWGTADSLKLRDVRLQVVHLFSNGTNLLVNSFIDFLDHMRAMILIKANSLPGRVVVSAQLSSLATRLQLLLEMSPD